MKITSNFYIDEADIQFTAIRSPGPGGQHVNKCATGILLRFNVTKFKDLPDGLRERLLLSLQNKLTAEGDILIKATRFRAQNLNKMDALSRFKTMLKLASIQPKKRHPTRLSSGIKKRRLEEKQRQGRLKTLRTKKPTIED